MTVKELGVSIDVAVNNEITPVSVPCEVGKCEEALRSNIPSKLLSM